MGRRLRATWLVRTVVYGGSGLSSAGLFELWEGGCLQIEVKVELKELLAVSAGRIKVNAKRYFSAL